MDAKNSPPSSPVTPPINDGLKSKVIAPVVSMTQRVKPHHRKAIALLVVILLLVGTGVFFMTKDKKKPVTVTKSTVAPKIFTESTKKDAVVTPGQTTAQLKEFEARLAAYATAEEKATIKGDLDKYKGTSDNDLSHRIVLYKTVLNKNLRQKSGDVVTVNVTTKKVNDKADNDTKVKVFTAIGVAQQLFDKGDTDGLNAELDAIQKMSTSTVTVKAALLPGQDLSIFTPVYSDSLGEDPFSRSLAALTTLGQTTGTVQSSSTSFTFVKLTKIGPATAFDGWAQVPRATGNTPVTIPK